jgi:MATE family multidrug resistance protein
MENILLVFGVESEVASYAQKYINSMIPGLFALGQYDLLRNFLNMVNKSHGPLIISLTGLLHPLWCYFIIWRTDLTVTGAALANSITYTLNFILLSLYTSYQDDLKEALFLPTKECFEGMGTYCKRGLWTSARVCVEMWSYEFMTFQTTFLAQEYTASQVICNNFEYLIYFFGYGFAMPASALVG